MFKCVEPGFSFKSPSNILIVGPTSCGKTTFLHDLLLENLDLFDERSPRVHYCYGSWQNKFDDMQCHGIEFFKGGGDDREILNLFTQYSHHMNVTVCYLCQDMLPQGKYAKTISRNAQYIIAFKNPRDKVALHTLLLQIYPTKWLPVMDIYNACMDRPYGYLLFDVHPASRDSTRLLSHLLQHEGCVRCYREK
ncbi:unnamed protein product [Pocillopora meandrina]|uniref:Uncharacterized protein n=1 Tax=Pocillopora meandrina TaxID=46732 RepID=A0AAU9WIU9_9CNID|nr:unnamed protein product [Pocillopora meandrina]